MKEIAYFMKDVGDAKRIRKRVLEWFEITILRTTRDKLREQLLKFAFVGGGPTGMEFPAELSDLVHEDLAKLCPVLVSKVKIIVFEVAYLAMIISGGNGVLNPIYRFYGLGLWEG